jgi:hypothetical protein
MCVRHAADQALALTLSHRHHQPSRFRGRLARGEHDLGNAAAQEAAEVEPRAPTELFQLERAQLGQRLVLCEVAGDQPAQDVSHSPARTSRMRCQCVPAQ